MDKRYEILSPLSTDEYAALRADIDLNGVRDPIYVDENGEILDGHHRAQIQPDCPRRVISGLTEAEKKAFVYRANLGRRNLSPEQKAGQRKQMKQVALELNEEGKTQTEIGALLGVAQRTVSDWLDISNSGSAEANKPKDLRIKLKPEYKAAILEAVEGGETQAQVAADFSVSQGRISQVMKTERKKVEAQAEREELSKNPVGIALPDGMAVLHGQFQDCGQQIEDSSVDLIFTDPPYNKEAIPLYGDLAQLAARVLKPGGSLIVYAGHYALPDIFPLMTSHLRFWWALALMQGTKAARLPGKWVFVGWKPLLWFVKEKRRDNEYVADSIRTKIPDKVADDWEQSLDEAAYYIERLTRKGELIFDPMMGSGTTLIAALRCGRRAIGMDKNEAKVAIATRKIADAHNA